MDLSKFKKFLDKAKEKHNGKYSYNVDIIPKNVKCKIEIICPIHGSFFATLDNHIHQGTGCPKCAGVVQSNTKQFIERCKDIFINKPYDYSNVEYINAHTPVNVICNEKDVFGVPHGIFQRKPTHLLSERGCPKCSAKGKTLDEQKFEANKIHNGKYDYSLWKNKVNNKTKIPIICHQLNEDGKEHGVFHQQLSSHLNGSGCPKCNGGVVENKEHFIKKANIIYNHFYSYEKFEYINAKTSGIIICPIHGEFSQTPYAHIVKKQGCPNCKGGQQQKPYGYWNVKSNCEAVAKECKNKNDFQLKYSSAYRSSLKNKWLDEFCEKYFSNEIQYHDYNEPIHLVYAYIFEEQKTCYVGRTNNIKRRHRQHKNGYKHTNGKHTFDNLYKFCKNNEIEMTEPIILEEGLNAPESQRQEDYWLNHYNDNGYHMINKAITGENKGSLGAVLKWNYDKCKELAKECCSKEDYKKKYVGAYNIARRKGWIYDFFDNVKKPNGYWNDLENCIEECKKYKNIKELAINCGSCYNAIRKNKWQNLIKFKE